MNIRTKIIIDRVIGPPLVFIINFILKVLRNTILKITPKKANDVKLILISKYLGYGSIIQATPLLRILKEHYPNAKLVFVTTSKMKPIIERIKIIDGVLSADDKNFIFTLFTSIKLAFKLLMVKADIFFDLEVYSAYSSLMVAINPAPLKLGFYRKNASYRLGVYSHLVFFNTQQHIMDIYLRLEAALYPLKTDSKVEELEIFEQDKEEIKTLLNKHGIENENYIIVNPNTSDLLLQRRWQAENFAKLIEDLVYIANFSGKTTLGGLIYLIKKCELLITNDSGPMHIAASLRKKTIALFGPVNPSHYGPRSNEILFRRFFCFFFF